MAISSRDRERKQDCQDSSDVDSCLPSAQIERCWLHARPGFCQRDVVPKHESWREAVFDLPLREETCVSACWLVFCNKRF